MCPPGVDNGTRIRLAGEGEAGMLGGPPRATSTLSLVLKNIRFLRAMSFDIHMELPVSVVQATLGTSVEIPTLEDETISPGHS